METKKPSRVEIDFRLRDQDGDALELSAADVESNVTVYEQAANTDIWEEIIYAAAGMRVSDAAMIDTEIVFVLDFTAGTHGISLPDGRTGTEAMLEGFQKTLDSLPDAYRVGVVEFHDRNSDPTVLSALTADHASVRSRVSNFAGGIIDHGSPRGWDAAIKGISLFSSMDANSGTTRALVLISNGRDAGSSAVFDDIAASASDVGASVHVVGIGNVANVDQMRNLAIETGGAYHEAEDAPQIAAQTQSPIQDILGTYRLTYVTWRATGEYSTQLRIEHLGLSAETVAGPFDGASFLGPDNEGIIVHDPFAVDTENATAEVYIRALHVPRGVDRIRLNPSLLKPVQVQLVPSADGGLLDDWNIEGPDQDGYYEASSEVAIPFGSSGLLFKLTYSDVTGRGPYSWLVFDETVYGDAKRLEASEHGVYIGEQPQIVFNAPARNFESKITVMDVDGSNVDRETFDRLEVVVDRGEYQDRTELYGHEEPALSPDGSRIAFVSRGGGQQGIYMVDADGSNLVPYLVDDDFEGRQPAWSPDGRSLAFTWYVNGNSDIFTWHTDFNTFDRLTNDPEGDYDPAWSPDGSRIAFTSWRDDGDRIYVMDADGSNVVRLNDDQTYGRNPAWSPDGRRIAFSSWQGGNMDIFVMDDDGSNLVRLTDSPESELDAAWSPDGRRIAFRSDREGNEDIYVMNTDGTNVVRITDNPGDDTNPSWSPDGTRIFYQSEPVRSDIYVVSADGTGLVGLTEDPVHHDFSPKFSPDGRRIAFHSERDENTEIYVMDTDGLNVVRLTDGQGWAEDPTWSPDGRRIAFRSWRDRNVDIYVMHADGSNVLQLTDDPAWEHNITWSPDGRRIAFSSSGERNADIYVADAVGSNILQLTDDPAWEYNITWSPDSRRIIFSSNSEEDENAYIYVADANGSNVVRLTEDQVWEGDPAWSPDGRRIAFRSYRDGNSAIYLADADGSNVVRLTDNPAWESEPMWSPDGRRIAFRSDRDGKGDIYVANVDGSNVVPLTGDDQGGWKHSTVWSPDGRRIAFLWNRDGNTDIYVADANGTNLVQLTDFSGYDVGQPIWSP